MKKTLDILHRITGIFSTITTELEELDSNLNFMSSKIDYLETEIIKLNEEKEKK